MQVHLLKASTGEMSSNSGIATCPLEILHNPEEGFAFEQK